MRSIPDTILVSIWLHFGTKKPSKSHLGGVLGRLKRVLRRLGASWGHLGSVLGDLGSVLGRLWAVLAPSWRHLERHLRLLGTSRQHFGVSLERPGTSWARLGACSDRKKMHIVLDSFYVSIFGRFCDPNFDPRNAKIVYFSCVLNCF